MVGIKRTTFISEKIDINGACRGGGIRENINIRSGIDSTKIVGKILFDIQCCGARANQVRMIIDFKFSPDFVITNAGTNCTSLNVEYIACTCRNRDKTIKAGAAIVIFCNQHLFKVVNAKVAIKVAGTGIQTNRKNPIRINGKFKEITIARTYDGIICTCLKV